MKNQNVCLLNVGTFDRTKTKLVTGGGPHYRFKKRLNGPRPQFKI